jgi:hypothetical protein
MAQEADALKTAGGPEGTIAARGAGDAAVAPMAVAPEGPGRWTAIEDQAAFAGGVALEPLYAVVKDGAYGVVLYALVAPESLRGWSLVPREASVQVGARERRSSLTAVSVASVGRVSLGAVSFHLTGEETGELALRLRSIVATSPDTGEETLLEGADWAVTPLSRGPGEAGALQEVPLRSDPCFVAAGVTLDLMGGWGCPQVSEGDRREAVPEKEDQPLEGGVQLRLVFYEPETTVVTVLVDADGQVRVLPE